MMTWKTAFCTARRRDSSTAVVKRARRLWSRASAPVIEFLFEGVVVEEEAGGPADGDLDVGLAGASVVIAFRIPFTLVMMPSIMVDVCCCSLVSASRLRMLNVCERHWLVCSGEDAVFRMLACCVACSS